jgi:hypothetical protein
MGRQPIQFQGGPASERPERVPVERSVVDTRYGARAISIMAVRSWAEGLPGSECEARRVDRRCAAAARGQMPCPTGTALVRSGLLALRSDSTTVPCTFAARPPAWKASGRAANENAGSSEQRRVHVFGARVRRRGEAGVRDLRGEDDGRGSQVVWLASRVSRCGGCWHAGVTCAESSSRASGSHLFGEWRQDNGSIRLKLRFELATICASDQGRA